MITTETIKSADDAARLLDINPTRAADWLGGVRRTSCVRISRFDQRYTRAIRIAVEEGKDTNWLENRLKGACDDVHRELRKHNSDWIENSFGPRPIQQARQRLPLRFEKAVVVALGFNRLLDDTFELQANEHTELYVQAHELSGCFFMFKNVQKYTKAANQILQTKLQDESVTLARLLASISETGDAPQSTAVLAAVMNDRDPDHTGKQKPAGIVASYRTQRLVLKGIDQLNTVHQMKRDDFTDRQEYILVQSKGERRRLALSSETIGPIRAVTRRPYNWIEESDDTAFPPKSDGLFPAELRERLGDEWRSPD